MICLTTEFAVYFVFATVGVNSSDILIKAWEILWEMHKSVIAQPFKVIVNTNETMREYMIIWRKNRKESADYDVAEERRKWREQHQKVREKAMDCLGGRHCVNCGCDNFSLLEINHINGGGRIASKTRSNRQLYRGISSGRVSLDEYNVLCRVCNALHLR